jgi:HlyD family secretion protein
MPVTFTVDSYRGQTFRGRVAAVRLNAQISNSVVTYPVWIEVPNPDLKLRPSMTANLQIVVDSAQDVLRVPVDAIRFRLTNDMYGWLGVPAPPPGRASRLDAVEVEPAEAPAKPHAGEHVQIDELFAPVPKKITPAIVWAYNETEQDPAKRLRQIAIRTGVSDGRFSEVVSGDLQPGMELVTAVYPPPSVLRARSTNPFGQPQRGFGGMTPGGPTPLPTLNRGGGGQPRGR